MKKLSIKLFLFCILLSSCKKDDPMLSIKSVATPPVINSPVSASSTVITANNLSDKLEFDWSKADYGVAAQVTYTLQLDSKCNSFTNPIILGTSNTPTMSFNLGDLNSTLINTLKVAPHKVAEVQLRVTATLNNKYLTTSNVVPIKITTWSDKPKTLWLGENSSKTPTLFSNAPSAFEGYRSIKASSSFRFSTNPVCADTVYGYAGTAGKISVDGSATNITMPRDGFYKFNVDAKNLTFDTVFIRTWGAIGSATSGGWNTSTPLTYNPDKDIWEGLGMNLSNGALKFRANDDWTINYGPAVIADTIGTLVVTNDAINIANPGVYDVTIDFSQTKSPYLYKYSVTKSGNIPEPAKLWLPGSYQGWNPSAAPTIYEQKTNVYNGYVKITNAPTGFGWKFTSAPDWNHINYGDSGTPGVLTTDGSANGMSLGVDGYYHFNVDVANLTYTAYLVNSFGVIGTATPGGWNSSSAMTYDNVKNVWTITLDLVAGALKFRANDDWALNYGPASSNDLTGILIDNDPGAISIPSPGNYTVTIDMSRSKASNYQYSYSIKLN